MSIIELHTALELPYPEINYPNNIYDAKLLMNDYAGKVSETTSIFQFRYQSYIIYGVDKEISKIFNEIAVTDMLHHELLAKAIVKLGGDPIISGLGPFWNGSYVYYTRNLRKMLNDDIRDKQTLIRNYTKTAMCLTEKSVTELINRIIQDEEIHIKCLKSILEYIS
ncbi:MAG: ferritin family protein [Christensenellales bacterium]|jgi:bacterioferritin